MDRNNNNSHKFNQISTVWPVVEGVIVTVVLLILVVMLSIPIIEFLKTKGYMV